MCPTLDPIVVNPPKDKETYTYSEKDIVNIVKSAVARGEIPTGSDDVNPNDNVSSFTVLYKYTNGSITRTKYGSIGLTTGTKEEIFDTIKSKVETLANALSITIDPITDLVSLNAGLNAVVTALITAGQTETVYGLLAAISRFDYCGNVTVFATNTDNIESIAKIGGYSIMGQYALPWLIGYEDAALVMTDFATLLASANVSGVSVMIPGLEE